jgi:uncharacterized protein YggT (Ycf19 family)
MNEIPSAPMQLSYNNSFNNSFLSNAGHIAMIFYYVIYILVILRIIFSLISTLTAHFGSRNPLPGDFSKFLVSITDPMLKPFMLIVPIGRSAIDLSPVILLKGLDIIKNITASFLA